MCKQHAPLLQRCLYHFVLVTIRVKRCQISRTESSACQRGSESNFSCSPASGFDRLWSSIDTFLPSTPKRSEPWLQKARSCLGKAFGYRCCLEGEWGGVRLEDSLKNLDCFVCVRENSAVGSQLRYAHMWASALARCNRRDQLQSLSLDWELNSCRIWDFGLDLFRYDVNASSFLTTVLEAPRRIQSRPL